MRTVHVHVPGCPVLRTGPVGEAFHNVQCTCCTLTAPLHDVFKWSQKLFLEPEVGQFTLLQELHGELSERVSHKE